MRGDEFETNQIRIANIIASMYSNIMCSGRKERKEERVGDEGAKE